jgi:hypothetical protein
MLMMSSPALALENGTPAYPAGLESAYTALVPPQGTTQFNGYLIGFNSDSYNGNTGKSSIPGFHLTAGGAAFRIWHTWNVDFDGVHVTSGVAPIFLEDSHVNAYGNGYHALSANELMIEPADLTKAFGNLHLFAGGLIYLPIGQHTPTNPASTSIGYTNFYGSFATTWFPNPLWDISTYTVYGTSLKDRITNYQSGDALDFDYGVSYRPFSKTLPKLALGFSGFILHQFTNDTLNGAVYNNGNKVQTFAIGPMVEWDFTPTTAILVKWQHTVKAQNAITGDRIWIMLATPLNF